MERLNASPASNPNPNGSLDPRQVSNPISTNSNLSSNATNPTSAFTGSNPNLNLQQQPSIARPASNQQFFSSNQQPIASSSKNTLESLQRNGNNPNGIHNGRPTAGGQSFARIGNVNQNRNLVLNRPQSQLDENQRIKFQIHSNFSSALRSDHSKILSPDYQTPFTGVVDALSRLLPYHVYDLAEEELLWAIEQPVVPQEWCDPEREKQAEKEFIENFGDGDGLREFLKEEEKEEKDRRKKRKRESQVKDEEEEEDFFKSLGWSSKEKGKGKERQIDLEEDEQAKIKLEKEEDQTQDSGIDDEEFSIPGSDYHPYPLSLALSFHSRHSKLSDRLRDLQRKSQTSHLDSRFQDVSLVQLERLALQKDKDLYAERVNELKELKLEALKLGIKTPGQQPPIQPGYSQSPSSSQSQRPSPTVQSWNGSPQQQATGNQAAQTNQQIRNPNYTNNQVHQNPTSQNRSNLPQSQPSSSNQTQSQSQNPSNPSSSSQKPGSGSGSGNSIPSHPIPLQIPITHLSRLTNLGIVPIPLPHLIPILPKLQSGERLEIGESTRARNPPSDQEHAAMLLGITERENSDGLGNTQMLNISVVLTKFDPKQLSGLAGLMQELQDGNKGNANRGGQK